MTSLTKCKERVRDSGSNFPRYHQCSRKAVREGYCRQHHPEAVEARRVVSQAAAEARFEKNPHRRLRRAMLRIAALKEVLQDVLDSDCLEKHYDLHCKIEEVLNG